MKNILSLSVFIFLSMITFAQVQFSSVKQGDTELISKARFGIDVGIPYNIVGPYGPIYTQKKLFWAETGLFITNNGVAYEEDQLINYHRTLGLNIPLRLGIIMNDKIYLGIGHNFNFPFRILWI